MAVKKDVRERILKALEKDSSSLRVAEQFGVSSSFVRRLRIQVRKEGRIEARHGGGKPAALREKDEEAVREIVAARPDATLNEMREQVKKRTKRKLSTTTMWRTLVRLGYSRKRKTIEATERSKEEVQAKRKAFRLEAGVWLSDRLVFIDETGVNLAMARAYGWGPVGERVVGNVPHHWDSVTLVAALRTTGIEAPFLFPNAMDTQALRTYVQQVLLPTLRPHDIVIWDNLRVHEDPISAELIRSAEAILKFLPPYSPDLNPIEHAWSLVKERLRQVAARTWNGLIKALDKALSGVGEEHALAWFSHCGYAT